jgi:hypothetical protein
MPCEESDVQEHSANGRACEADQGGSPPRTSAARAGHKPQDESDQESGS